MPSRSFATWRGSAARSLDEIELAHRAVGGSGPGRRYATQQINQAYAVMLSSQFQRYCRDLHSEGIDVLANQMPSIVLIAIFQAQMTNGRKLDTGNPNPGNIGSDFGRFRINFWPAVMASDARNAVRRSALEDLNRWRNAIAHQDFDPAQLGGTVQLHLSQVRRWRMMCDGLVQEFDQTLARHLATITGAVPW